MECLSPGAGCYRCWSAFSYPVLDARFAKYCEELCKDPEEPFQRALIRKLAGASSAKLFQVTI